MRGKEVVRIEGPVQQPGAYKYADGMTLQDLILRADGFTPKASPSRIDVARRITGGKNEGKTQQIAHIYHFSVNPNLTLNPGGRNFILHPYDIVYVRSEPGYHKQEEVTIAGQVRYPGTYSLKSKNSRISDLIKRAGGLTNSAYPQGASLYRKLTKTQLQGGIYQAGVRGILTQTTQRADTTRRKRNQLLQLKPKRYKISRVGIQLPQILKHPNSKYDLLLKEGDSLFIPRKLETVFVKGGVYDPTNIRYDKRLTYQDYISAAGGYNQKAEKNQGYVIYANGKVKSVRQFLFFKNYPEVKPGATIVVPVKTRVRRLSPLQRTTILSAIISTIALVTTTIIQITR